jgi:hypothetical protein
MTRGLARTTPRASIEPATRRSCGIDEAVAGGWPVLEVDTNSPVDLPKVVELLHMFSAGDAVDTSPRRRSVRRLHQTTGNRIPSVGGRRARTGVLPVPQNARRRGRKCRPRGAVTRRRQSDGSGAAGSAAVTLRHDHGVGVGQHRAASIARQPGDLVLPTLIGRAPRSLICSGSALRIRHRGSRACKPRGVAALDLSCTCPDCGSVMQPEHAHYRCPVCGYRDTCCDGAPAEPCDPRPSGDGLR